MLHSHIRFHGADGATLLAYSSDIVPLGGEEEALSIWQARLGRTSVVVALVPCAGACQQLAPREVPRQHLSA